jgi:hypothetical protein
MWGAGADLDGSEVGEPEVIALAGPVRRAVAVQLEHRPPCASGGGGGGILGLGGRQEERRRLVEADAAGGGEAQIIAAEGKES